MRPILVQLSYDELVAGGYISIETGKFSTGTSTNSSFSSDARVYFDADGFAGEGSRVIVATLEDTKIASGDFLV